MVRRASLLALAGLSLAIAPAALADPSVSDQGTPAAAGASAHKKAVDSNVDDSAVICHREDTTGSRLGATKTCHTRAEWNARAQSARSQVSNWQSQSNMTAPH